MTKYSPSAPSAEASDAPEMGSASPIARPLLTYVAMHTILHDGRRYHAGEPFVCADEATIAHLRARGAIKLPAELESPARSAEVAARLTDENAALQARLTELEAALAATHSR